MKRRSFIISLLSSTALLTSKSGWSAISSSPQTTSSESMKIVADEFPQSLEVLLEIQKNYPSNIIESHRTSLGTSDLHSIREKIRNDYESGNCHIIAGWMISDTEALCIAAAGSA